MAGPKVGDDALVFGRELEVTGIEPRELSDGTEVEVAVLEDTEGKVSREKAIGEFRELRDDMADMNAKDRAAAEKRLAQLDEQAREALFRFKLRMDLLSYWQDREVWVSDGRILSEAQREVYREVTGRTGDIPWSQLERQALSMYADEMAAAQEGS